MNLLGPPTSSWRATILLLFCAISAAVTEVVVWTFRAPALVPIHVLELALFVLSLTIMMFFRKATFRETLSSWIFLTANLILIAMICLNHEYYIRDFWRFEAFVGIKIIAIFLPLIFPPRRWVGGACLAALAVAPFLQYYLWDPASKEVVGIQEPWVTFIFVLCSAVIYFGRMRILHLHREQAELVARAQALRRIAHLLLGAQHLMNTPLQTIELTMQLLENEYPTSRNLIKGTEKSFTAVRRVSRALSFTDSNVLWDEVKLPARLEDLELEIDKISRELET